MEGYGRAAGSTSRATSMKSGMVTGTSIDSASTSRIATCDAPLKELSSQYVDPHMKLPGRRVREGTGVA